MFMHPKFASKCNADIRFKDHPREVRLIDGQVIDSGLITHQALVQLVIRDHCEILLAEITNTGQYACILGMPWLVQYDPTIT